MTFVGSHAGQNVDPIMGDATSATSGTQIRLIELEYDKTNNITAAEDSDSSYAYTFDNLGRLLTVDNDETPGVPNVVLTSVYDSVGNRTSLAATIDSTDDFENAYTFDALNRLTRLDQIGVSGGNSVAEKRIDFAYNAVGQFNTIARYNDTAGGSGDEIATSTYSYDSAGKLTGLMYKQGGTNLFTPYSWTFDNASRITQFVSADGTSNYTHDKTSQLTAADHNYQSDESYSYDANGNRDSTGYTTGTDNRMTADGTYTYTYDDEGNRTSRTHNTTDYATLYEWDYRNRLSKVTELDDSDDALKVVQYTYDLFDRRIGKAVDTTSPFNMADAAIERFVYDDPNGVSSVDGGNVVLDFVDPDGSGSTAIALSARQLYANRVDQILAKEDVTVSTSSADRVQWPLVDHLGTVRDLVENDGALGEHYEYDSYGQVVSGDTSVIRYLYTSREHDPDTGLQYNRARWYDAAVGRWISQDPIGFAAGDANLSRYTANAVTVMNDPSGLQPPRPRPEDEEGMIESLPTRLPEVEALFAKWNRDYELQRDLEMLIEDPNPHGIIDMIQFPTAPDNEGGAQEARKWILKAALETAKHWADQNTQGEQEAVKARLDAFSAKVMQKLGYSKEKEGSAQAHLPPETPVYQFRGTAPPTWSERWEIGYNWIKDNASVKVKLKSFKITDPTTGEVGFYIGIDTNPDLPDPPESP